MADPLRPSAEEAIAEWRRRVRANREQVDRVREVEDGADFYAPVASAFRADPHRQDDPVLNVLRTMIRPHECWLDIGAGGGRYALPIALQAREVIAVEPSAGMLAVLQEGMENYGIRNIRIVHGRFPMSGLEADVALICHVGYDIEEIGPFLAMMERSAPRRIAVLFERQPTAPADALWPAVHGEPRETLPALREFIILLLARRVVPNIVTLEVPGPSYDSPERALDFARRQTWVRPGSEKDARLERIVRERLIERDGRFAYSWDPVTIGIVSW
ncbi:MAG: methyltransferase domain-containing protein [Chloroflexota bacterium]|nr:methyltransferase domain-containing protein [Dehalococcoidia bacterium]MDW8253652.1 methyltransferase domain-containing protein [Chloroflexota bacterium]